MSPSMQWPQVLSQLQAQLTNTSMPRLYSSLRSLQHYATILSYSIALWPRHPSALAVHLSSSCPNPQLSCHNTSTIVDTCCVNSPGGQLLQTQLWQANPARGPSDAWTIHGLWPDNCDGTYDAFCDHTRFHTNISAILTSAGATQLLAFMDAYWTDSSVGGGVGSSAEAFWEHEWNKHGTCISTLDPKCYEGYNPQEEVVDFFQRAVDVYNTLPSYKWLASAGIVPSNSQTYTSDAIVNALKAPRGVSVSIQCTAGALDEIWYFFDVRGPLQTGQFVPAEPDGAKSSCPATGVKYLPKQEDDDSCEL